MGLLETTKDAIEQAVALIDEIGTECFYWQKGATTPIKIKILLREMGVAELDVNGISRDPDVVQAYIDDPLVFHDKTPARLGAELLSAIQRVTAQADQITLPLMIVQGDDDSLIDPSGARTLYDMVSSEDKTLKIFDGLYHEVFNEPERDAVLKDVEDWLETHL